MILVLIDFFSNHHISLNNLFVVCARFRNSVLGNLQSAEFYNKDVFYDTVHILDRNFANIITEYNARNCKSNNETIYPPLENNLLLHADTVSAKQLFEKNEIYDEDIKDILDVQNIIAENLDEMHLYDDKTMYIKLIAQNMQKLGTKIAFIVEFSDISKAMTGLSVLVEKNLDEILNEEKSELLSVMLEALVHDITKWSDEIFIKQSSTDIHFLDPSIISSTNQILISLDDDNENLNDNEIDDIFF